MKRERFLMFGGVLLLVGTVLCAVCALPPLSVGRPDTTVTTVSTVSVTTQIRKVNINTATADQLRSTLGIRETLAQKIVAFRLQNGGFSSLYQLTAVEGITRSRVREWEKYLSLSDENT